MFSAPRWLRHLGILGNFVEGDPDNLRAGGSGFGEFDGRLAFRGAGDNTNAVCAVLFDRGSDLTQPVHDLAFDLLDHSTVSEVNFADVD